MFFCNQCGERLSPSKGRRKKYCSDLCRQKAYYIRKTAHPATTPDYFGSAVHAVNRLESIGTPESIESLRLINAIVNDLLKKARQS